MSNKAGSSSGTEPADVSILHTAIDSIKEILFANGSKDSPIYAAITDGPHPVTVISVSILFWKLS